MDLFLLLLLLEVLWTTYNMMSLICWFSIQKWWFVTKNKTRTLCRPGGQHEFSWWVPLLGRQPALVGPRCCSAPLPRARWGCCPVWSGTPRQSTGGNPEWWCDRCASSQAPPECQALRAEEGKVRRPELHRNSVATFNSTQAFHTFV